MIYSHECKQFNIVNKLSEDNSIYEQSVKLVKEIIPQIKTKRSWATVNLPTLCEDKCIVVISRKNVEYLAQYKDLILICADEERKEELEQFGKVLIIDIFSEEGIQTLQNELNKIDGEVEEKIEKNKVDEFLEKFDV